MQMRLTSVLKRTVGPLTGLAVLAAFAYVALFLAGYRPVVVYSGSMEPGLSVGTLAFVESVPAEEVEVGDVITFTDPPPARPSRHASHRRERRDPRGRARLPHEGRCEPQPGPLGDRPPGPGRPPRFRRPVRRLRALVRQDARDAHGPHPAPLRAGARVSPPVDLATSRYTCRGSCQVRSRTLLVGSIVALAAVLAVGGFTRMTSASFTDGLTTGGNSVTVDKLSNHFAVTPGSSATGNVDSLSINLGLVTSPQTITNVFTVQNVSSTTRTATLVVLGPNQLGSATFAQSGSASVTLARSLERRLPDDLPLCRRPRHRPDQAQARQLDLALPHYSVTLRRGASAPASLNATAIAAAESGSTGPLQHDDEPRGYDSTARPAAAGRSATPAHHGQHLDGHLAPNGTQYSYRVRAVSNGTPSFESVDSPTVTARADSTAPTRPSAVALANGGGQGNAYINLANRASVSVTVTLPASSVSTDVVTVTISRSGTSVSKSASATNGRHGHDHRHRRHGRWDGSVTIAATAPTLPATPPPRARRLPPRTPRRRTRPPRPTTTATTRTTASRHVRGERDGHRHADRAVGGRAVHGHRLQRRRLHGDRRPGGWTDLGPDHGHLPRDGDRPGREHERGDHAHVQRDALEALPRAARN